MRKSIVGICLAVLIACSAVGSAKADDGLNPDVIFGNLVECVMGLENPSWHYYEPWNLRYVEANVYANCFIRSGAIKLPYNMAGIILDIDLYRRTGVDLDGMIIWTKVAWGTDVNFNTSLGHAKAVHICGPYGRSGIPDVYQAKATGYFQLPSGMAATVNAVSWQLPMFCT